MKITLREFASMIFLVYFVYDIVIVLSAMFCGFCFDVQRCN